VRDRSNKTIWTESFQEPFNALAFAVKGDTSLNMLWRMNNGELPEIFRPPVIFVQAGLNDLYVQTQSAIEVIHYHIRLSHLYKHSPFFPGDCNQKLRIRV
jgi:hypothetical protein